MSNNGDLIDNVSLLPPLGKNHHSAVLVNYISKLVNYSSNKSTDKFYLDNNNVDFDSMQKIFNGEFNIMLKDFTDVNDQLSYFVKTLDKKIC